MFSVYYAIIYCTSTRVLVCESVKDVLDDVLEIGERSGKRMHDHSN